MAVEMNGTAAEQHAELPAQLVPAAKPGPQMEKRTKWLNLPDQYAGFRVRVWINAPDRVMNEAVMAGVPEAPDYSDLERRARELIAREDAGEDVADLVAENDAETNRRRNEYRHLMREAEEKRLAALCRIVLEHNGWRDFDGNPYPAPTTREFWDEIPTELATAILILLREEAARLPNALARTRRR